MMMQLLQRGFNPPPAAPNPANNPAFAAGLAGGFAAVVCIGLVVLLVFYVPYVFMLVRAMQALQAVRPRNRSMPPGLVWVALIPCANVVMNFVIVLKTSQALENEFEDRRMRSRGDHGKQLGMAYAVLVLLNIGLSGISQGLQAANGGGNAPPGFGPLAAAIVGLGCFSCVLSIAQIVLPLVYATRLHTSTQRLQRDDDKYGNDDRDDDDIDDDFEEDDEPKPRGKPRKQIVDDFEEFDQSKPKPKKKPKLDDGFEEYDEPKGGR